ncbi:hypothetical protein BRADI_3g22515v3 [Brachypodium distachyon]|uniref:Uncharacterized protein n=1 Tax=Brachypodium distachyon TaxID=15368 RepID=A0A2K2CYU6_BRADI|nr:hypothetical protein BRADI_3g22515v3 [Brachypodium distachyon]
MALGSGYRTSCRGPSNPRLAGKPPRIPMSPHARAPSMYEEYIPLDPVLRLAPGRSPPPATVVRDEEEERVGWGAWRRLGKENEENYTAARREEATPPQDREGNRCGGRLQAGGGRPRRVEKSWGKSKRRIQVEMTRTKLPPPSTTAAVSLPVVDLSLCRYEVRRAVFDASKGLGFFQAAAISLPAVDLFLDRDELGPPHRHRCPARLGAVPWRVC